jgi:hypothetical protein
VHCYEDRFRPYYGAERDAVVWEAVDAHPRIIENLPERMTYLDWNTPDEKGLPRERRGRIILAGGEIILEPVREPVLYAGIALMREKYKDNGGVDIIVQTTGDVLTEKILDEMLERGVRSVSISGMDAYHEGFEDEAKRQALMDKLRGWFEARKMKPSPGQAWKMSDDPADDTRFYHFFGANPEEWIGPIWPRGRAFENEISTADLSDNFCNGWSGGLNFLDRKNAGSEVSIEPNGNVYPCCMKTKLPVGNLKEKPLEEILDGHKGNPIYEAISMGHPERMGIQHGWSVEKFLEKSIVRMPSGKIYRNLCVGCDRFHEEVLGAESAPLVTIAEAS